MKIINNIYYVIETVFLKSSFVVLLLNII